MTDTVTTPSFVSYLYAWQRDALNRTGLRVITPATEEPITLAEAAAHLCIDAYGSPAEYPDATLIEALITAAREYVEHETALTLAPMLLELSGRTFYAMCRWPGDLGIELRTAPVYGVPSVTYLDGTGVTQTISPDDYYLDEGAQVPTLYPAYGTTLWPSGREQAGAVRIQFQAGYTAGGSPTTAEIPQSLRAAILLMLGHLYENREASAAAALATIPLGITALVQRHRIRNGFA